MHNTFLKGFKSKIPRRESVENGVNGGVKKNDITEKLNEFFP